MSALLRAPEVTGYLFLADDDLGRGQPQLHLRGRPRLELRLQQLTLDARVSGGIVAVVVGDGDAVAAASVAL